MNCLNGPRGWDPGIFQTVSVRNDTDWTDKSLAFRERTSYSSSPVVNSMPSLCCKWLTWTPVINGATFNWYANYRKSIFKPAGLSSICLFHRIERVPPDFGPIKNKSSSMKSIYFCWSYLKTTVANSYRQIRSGAPKNAIRFINAPSRLRRKYGWSWEDNSKSKTSSSSGVNVENDETRNNLGMHSTVHVSGRIRTSPTRLNPTRRISLTNIQGVTHQIQSGFLVYVLNGL